MLAKKSQRRKTVEKGSKQRAEEKTADSKQRAEKTMPKKNSYLLTTFIGFFLMKALMFLRLVSAIL